MSALFLFHGVVLEAALFLLALGAGGYWFAVGREECSATDRRARRLNFFLCFAVACVALLLGINAYARMALIGFPDGYKTAFDMAMEPMLPLLIALHATVATAMGYLSVTRPTKHRYTLLVAYLLLLLVFWCAEVYFYNTLDHGQGG